MQLLPLASAVAEFGSAPGDAPRNDPRWDALARRVDQLAAPASLASEVDGFRELVAHGARTGATAISQSGADWRQTSGPRSA